MFWAIRQSKSRCSASERASFWNFGVFSKFRSLLIFFITLRSSCFYFILLFLQSKVFPNVKILCNIKKERFFVGEWVFLQIPRLFTSYFIYTSQILLIHRMAKVSQKWKISDFICGIFVISKNFSFHYEKIFHWIKFFVSFFEFFCLFYRTTFWNRAKSLQNRLLFMHFQSFCVFH